MTTVASSVVERPAMARMLADEVNRRMDTVRSLRFVQASGEESTFTLEQHLQVAQSQLLEILQYGAAEAHRPLNTDAVLDHVVIALSHLGVARDGLGEWQHGARSKWSGDSGTAAPSLVLSNGEGERAVSGNG